MNSYLASPVEFIISTLFGLYILAVMLRFLLGVVRADFYNPVSQFLVKITNPALLPLRKIIPGVGKIDIAAIVLMLLLQIIMLAIIVALRGVMPPLLPLLLTAVGELVMLVINIFLVAIIVQVIISWINPGSYNPVNSLLQSLTAPLLRPIQRMLPPLSGIDLSPLFALIGLQVLRMLIMPLLGQAARVDAAWFHRDGGDLVLSLHIQPNASRDGIDGLHGGRLKLRLASPPVDGRANARLQKFLAAQFGVPQRQILIETGMAGRHKRVRIRRPARVPPELADLID